jgi:hypothetical protein
MDFAFAARKIATAKIASANDAIGSIKLAPYLVRNKFIHRDART